MNPILVQAQKFEEFIISVLKQICIKENKPIIVEADLNNLYKNNVLKDYPIIFNKVLKREVRFDVFLPNGFLHFDKPVFVEIKYGNYKKNFDDLCPDFGEHISLYIVKSNNNFNKNIRQVNNNEIIVWDEEYIGGWEKEYAVDYYGLYSSNIPEDNLIEFFNKNETNKKLLRKQIQENNLSLSLGAGVSIDFGSFKWDLLIKQFYNEIQKDGKINDIIGVQEKIGGTSIINGQFTEDNLKDFMKSLYDGLYSKYNPNQIYSFSTISHL